MSLFKKWPILNRCLKQGSLAFIDLSFAASVLNKLNSEKEEHAALLSILFALSRHGHLTLNIAPDALRSSLGQLAIEDVHAVETLIRHGVVSFPQQGIATTDTLRPNAWICSSGSHYYLQKNWVYESEIISSLNRLSKSLPKIDLPMQVIDARLNAAQKQAVEQGMKNSLSFLTGGPGTGKTFTAAALVKSCLDSIPDKKHQFRIILTAPTGKAVAQLEGNLKKTLGEMTNLRAGTLHAVLGLKMHVHEDEEILPLFADLVIVDECSMIDAKIFSKLLLSIPSGARLVLIGDKDQLPPVEAGSIFADLLDSGRYPATCLTECLRSDRSEILNTARLIKEGNCDAVLQFLLEKQSRDIVWSDLLEEKYSPSQQYSHFWESCKRHFPTYYTELPQPDEILRHLGRFSLLSCMRQGPLGVDAINSYFLHQSLRQVPAGSWWAAPIMITRNDHELELYNGDLGFLVREVTQDFSLRQFHIEDYAIFYDRKGGVRQIAALALTAFEYSYCLSVHKSQGSEYEEVLILMPRGSELFGREVLYTALTRARSKVSLIAGKDLLREMVANSSRKISGLSARLQIKT